MAGNPLMQMMGVNNPMVNHPVMRLIGALKNGGNPQAMLQQMIGQNPQVKQIADSVQGKSPQQMGEYMKAAATQKGVDLGQLASQLGMPEDVAAQLGIKM